MDIPDIAEQLDSAIRAGEYNGYGPRPIPHPLDDRGEALLQAVNPGDGTANKEVLAYMDPALAFILLAYAERTSALAVRLKSVPTLEKAIVALALAEPFDSREKLLVLPLPWHAADRLGANPRAVFERVAAGLPEPGRSDLLMFANREPKNQTLEVMGYAESEDEDGFRFKRSW